MSSLFILFILFACCFTSSYSAMVSLAGNDWMITDNQSLSAQGQVPGTIHTILFNAMKIPDPYLGYDDVDLRSLVYSRWTFRKKFSLTDDFLASAQFAIHFDQIDTVANITLNGCFLGFTNNMFLAYTFDVMKSCLQSQNELKIDFDSPVTYALQQSKAYGDTVPPDCPSGVQHGECHVNFIRKEPCSFSWDWGPAFAPIGIPGNLYLEGKKATDIIIQLESVNVAALDASSNKWRVDVLLSSDNAQFQTHLKFSIDNTPFSFETDVTFNHNLAISLMIPSDNVQLWWPNGYGNQTLYNLSVYNQGQLVGARQTGFRTVELAQHTYDGNIKGNSFYFVINGHPIFAKGSNWIPPDSFQERVTDERLDRLLGSAQLANMNILRVWGGGIYERDSFYEIADRRGIMLWHDFMFACSLYPVDQPFLDNVHKEVIYQVKRLQSHPSIVLWSGNNENEAAIAQNWYGIPAAKMPKAKDDYRTLYVSTVMSAVQEVDKGTNRPYVTSSPSNGVETVKENYVANNPQDPLYGDVHYYGYTDDSWNPNTYPIVRFLSETGIQALPSLDTWRQVTQNISDFQFESDFVKHREHSGGRLESMQAQIKSNLPVPVTKDSLKQFVHMIYLSQINQAMTLKSISDVCRVHSSVAMIDPGSSQGNTMGLMYWQINDIWQAPTWATIEYALKWKMGHYYVKHMYEPVYPLPILKPYLASITDPNARISIYVINEMFAGTKGQLTCSFYALNSFMPKLSMTYNISTTSPDVNHIDDLVYSTVMKSANCADGNQCILRCYYSSAQEDVGQTLFLTQPKNYQLQQPNLRVQNIQQASLNEVKVTLTATQPALFVWLDVSIDIPGYFSRNGFHMFEATRTVSFFSWAPMTDAQIANLNVAVSSLFDVTQP